MMPVRASCMSSLARRCSFHGALATNLTPPPVHFTSSISSSTENHSVGVGGRSYSSTTPHAAGHPLDQFRDSVSREKRFSESVGRSWTVKELRRKSFDDLHKLWYVLYKEKNMLLTESHIARQQSAYFPQQQRKQKVKKSMAAIKVVLGERKQERIAQHTLKMAAQKEAEQAAAVEAAATEAQKDKEII